MDGDTNLHLLSIEFNWNPDGNVILTELPLNIPIGESTLIEKSVVAYGDGSITLTESIFKSYFLRSVKWSFYLNYTLSTDS